MTNEMIMMRPRKATNAAFATQVQELRSNRGFLDILRETCARDGGRYTLRVESGSADYTVLVDRGGPFNAVGGASAGIQALVGASQLRSGRCTITIGWPVDQPLFQPGLDITMKTLVGGVVELQDLPRHRGVESLRNSEWREARTVKPAPAAPATPAPAKAPAAPAPAVAPALTAPPQARATRPIPPPPRAPVAPAPVLAPAPSPEPKMAWKPVGSASAWLPVTEVAVALPDADRPAVGKVHAYGGGAARHFATRALLWLVECDDPSGYSLEQAATMARHSFTSSISQVVHPFRQDLDQRVSRIKEDWEKSGEVAAKAKRKRRGKSTPVDPDADREFRLH